MVFHKRLTILFFFPAFLAALSLLVPAQETRSTISGRVLDPHGAVVAGARVVVTRVETDARTNLTTNETGYYEARLLMPGTYVVTAETEGFKKSVRQGITLTVAAEAQVDIILELGGLSEVVTVIGDAPLIETTAGGEGGLMDNQSISDLPVLGGNALLLAKLVPGLQTSGEADNYLGLHSISGGSNYYTPGKVGGNEWSIDGVPNQGGNRNAAYMPHSDTVQEFRVENMGFDVSRGRGTGASINIISKAGSNRYHGTLTWQHWQQRLNATPFYIRQLYLRNIAAAEAAGDLTTADRLRHSPRQASGHSNIYSASFGGPVIIPRIYNGTNKLFSLFTFSGYVDRKSEDADTINITLPSMANRQGDFSQLLKVNPVKYQIYDPLTIRRDTSRTGTHYIRDPFPGNIIPATRMINPIYDAYVKFLPTPNNEPLDPTREPINNYLATATPYNWNYKAFNQRVDYLKSERNRFFLRWSYNNFIEDRQDWTYETVRGLHTNGLRRQNIGATMDWTWMPGARTIFDFAVAGNQYRDGSEKPVPLSYKPSSVGFPAYMDTIAGDRTMLPQVRVQGYKSIGLDREPTYSNYRMFSAKADVSHLMGKHTLRAGADTRQHFRTGVGQASYGMSGRFEFRNDFTRCCDDTVLYTPGDLGLNWAAFFMGLPRYERISTSNASYAMHSPYYGGYVQDTWRLSRKLSVNLGFRLEYELGPTERYDRMVGHWDPEPKLPFSDLSEAAYAKNPVAGMDPSEFKVRGGSVFPNLGGEDRHLIRAQWMWMPRAAFAYQLDRKTVIRGGWGTFYDTLNTLNYAPDQAGYTRNTETSIYSTYGLVWRVGDPANGISPLTDPFPLRADGTRVLPPLLPAHPGNELIAFSGLNFDDFYAYDTTRAHIFRWRASLQRELGKTMALELAYSGALGNDVYIDTSRQQNLNALPKQYWSDGLTRANSSSLTTTVPNPFNIANLAPLQASDPQVYAELAAIPWFTDATKSRQQLLRPFPQMNSSITRVYDSRGKVRTGALEMLFQRRFSKGLSMNAGYTWLFQNKSADWFANPCDSEPSWRLSNNGRPRRLTLSGVYQLPFGKGRSWLNNGLLSRVFGGFQMAGTYEFQQGPLLDFGNVFYYGDMKTLSRDLKTDSKSLDRWFNSFTVQDWYEQHPEAFNSILTPAQVAGLGGPRMAACYVDKSGLRVIPRSAGMGFESCSAYAPDGNYNLRTFPQRVQGIRADGTNLININLQRQFRLSEKLRFNLRVDALNVTNRSRFKAPSTDPTSTNFGRVTEQSAGMNRFFQVQARLQF